MTFIALNLISILAAIIQIVQVTKKKMIANLITH